MAIAVATTATTTFAAGTTTTITKPTGLAVGDLLVAAIGANAGVGITIDTKSGWTLAATQAATNTSISLQYRIADSADVAASNFVFSCPSASRMAGALMRVTGHAATSTLDEVDSDNNNTAASATINFSSTVTPYNAGNLVVLVLNGSDGNDGGASMSSYTTTPSITFTELIDTTADSGTSDPVFAAAYAVYSGSSQITAYGATISGTKDDHAGILGIFQAQVNGSGTHTLHTADADFFANAGVTVGGSGTMALHSADADFFTTNGSANRKTAWTRDTKNSTTWTRDT